MTISNQIFKIIYNGWLLSTEIVTSTIYYILQYIVLRMLSFFLMYSLNLGYMYWFIYRCPVYGAFPPQGQQSVPARYFWHESFPLFRNAAQKFAGLHRCPFCTLLLLWFIASTMGSRCLRGYRCLPTIRVPAAVKTAAETELGYTAPSDQPILQMHYGCLDMEVL